jgi:DNA-binding CsgD family transcriptional regulator
MLESKTYENIIIIGTDSKDIGAQIMEIVKRFSNDKIIQVNSDYDFFNTLSKYKPRLIFLESNCWFSATPYKISEILNEHHGLRIAVFNKERMLGITAARYITHGNVFSFIDMRSDQMRGKEKEYIFGFQQTIHGNIYMPKYVEEAIEENHIDNIAGYANTQTMTDHQLEIAVLTAEGKSSKYIASILKISSGTVRNIQHAIRAKFGLHSQNEFIYLMLQLGYLTTEEIEANVQRVVSKTNLRIQTKTKKKEIA